MKTGDYAFFRTSHGIASVLRVGEFRHEQTHLGWDLRKVGTGELYTAVIDDEITIIPTTPKHQMHRPARTLNDNIFIPVMLMYSIPYKTYIYHGRYADRGITLS